MLIAVISPAKKLETDPAPDWVERSIPDFLDQTERLLELLRPLGAAGLRDLMKLSEALATLNAERFAAFSLPFTRQNSKQAALAFRGDTYVGLDADTLDADGWAFAQDHLRILSGFYGLLRPLDLMQPYRLEMGTRLANPRGKDLYAFWGERLTEAINGMAPKANEGMDPDAGGATLVNLASNEYFKAIRPRALTLDLVSPAFKERRNGRLQVIGLMAKRARGRMARFIIDHRLSDPDALRDFRADGYRFAPELSTPAQPIFVRG